MLKIALIVRAYAIYAYKMTSCAVCVAKAGVLVYT